MEVETVSLWHFRAVAMFFKDHVPSTSSDDQPGKFTLNRILEGKARKQAARMFFETTVTFRIAAVLILTCSSYIYSLGSCALLKLTIYIFFLIGSEELRLH